ncbi:hypothetical protein PBY51_009686 [Eleginops maclovinus]|uniref:Uncharacterized protein n=1 Tax=Eleginops maclovinus TaxID=56733 RepID=A0AAN8AU35_ELEMC|nr:hypothetical protein PBY51_009686 [Eleginops maclovinus]
MFDRLSCVYGEEPQHLREKDGEEKREEKEKEVGLQTELDMSPVLIHRWRVIGSVSSVCGLCCCQESIEDRGRVAAGLKG